MAADLSVFWCNKKFTVMKQETNQPANIWKKKQVNRNCRKKNTYSQL